MIALALSLPTVPSVALAVGNGSGDDAASARARLPGTTTMDHQMRALRTKVERLQSEMQDLDGSDDPSERQRLMTAHLANLRQTLTQVHAMEVQMVEQVRAGRLVSDADLGDRQRLLAEQTEMLLQMLERTVQAAGGCAATDPPTQGGADSTRRTR